MASLAEGKNTNPDLQGLALEFNYLPGYAKFLLKNKLDEFAREQLRISREIKIPLLKYLESMSEEELIELAVHGAKELLQFFSENRVQEFIGHSVKSWISNTLPIIQNHEIVAQDISLVSFVRRKAFRDFLPHYSSDIHEYISIMEEVDRFTIKLEETLYQTLFDLQKQKIKEDHYFIDKINSTIPGIVYVFDLLERKEIYSNQKRQRLLGYTDSEMKEMGSSVINMLLHPNDLAHYGEYNQAFSTSADGEVRTIEYRIKDKHGNYPWYRSYETVFKRNENGIPTQIIGVAIDVTKEKEIAFRLQASERELLEAQEIAGLGSFEWNLEQNDSTFSPQLLKIFVLEGKSNLTEFLEYVHSGDRPKVKSAIEKALKGESDYECEYRYLKGGNEKVIWSRGVVTFRNGKPLKMKGTVMDVTQRHQVLQRLEQSEELHKQAQALTHIGNWSWSLSDNKISWSDELYRIYGLEPQSEEITLERFISFVHPNERKKRQQQIQQAINIYRAEDYIMRIVLDNDTEKILSGKGQVLVDENNIVYKLVGTCQDITKEEQLNKKLKENEKTFRQLIYNAPDAVIMIDEQSHILLWNPKAKEIFGWEEGEAIGKLLVDIIIPPQYRQAHLDGLDRLQTTGEARVLNQTLEITALNKKGKEFYIALSIARWRRAGKAVFISFIRDISKEKKAEMELEENRNRLADLNQSLEQKNQELERSNQELSSFNYIASHDLQEPLRKIKIFTNRIVETASDVLPDTAKDSLKRVISSAERMQTLIDDLLSFSRTSTSEKAFELVDLNTMIDEVQNSLKYSIEEKNVRLISSSLPSLNLIRFQFHQLLENIIANAIKYSKKDVPPEIKISASTLAGKQIAHESAKPNKNYCMISIADNGIGFSQQYEKRIFELFQRLHGKDEYSGTGIGLAICKKIADNHEGFITAEGKAGVGAVFNIFIPL